MPILLLFLAAIIASMSVGYFVAELGHAEADDVRGELAGDENPERQAVVFTNRENALVLETQIAPGAIYDVTLWNYDRQFADDVGLTSDDVFYIDPPQDHIKAIGLSVVTKGMANECSVHLLTDQKLELKLPHGTWDRGTRARGDLLIVSRGFVDPESRRVADRQSLRRYEEFQTAYSGHAYRTIFPSLPEGSNSAESTLWLQEANFELGVGSRLLYLRFAGICEAVVGASLPNDVEKQSYVTLRRKYPTRSESSSEEGGLLDDHNHFNVLIPDSLVQRAEPVFLSLLDDERLRRRFVWAAGELVNQVTLAPEGSVEKLVE